MLGQWPYSALLCDGRASHTVRAAADASPCAAARNTLANNTPIASAPQCGSDDTRRMDLAGKRPFNFLERVTNAAPVLSFPSVAALLAFEHSLARNQLGFVAMFPEQPARIIVHL